MRENHNNNNSNPFSKAVCARLQKCTCSTALILLVTLCSMSEAAKQEAAPQITAPVSVAKDAHLPAGAALRFAPDAYERLHSQQRVRLTDFPLDEKTSVDLDLEQFTVTTSATVIVEGTAEGDRPISHPQVALFKGQVVGVPDSHAVLGISPHGNSGAICLGDRQYFLAARHDRAKAPNGAEHVIYERADMSAVENPVGMTCYTKYSGAFVEPVETQEAPESFAWRVAFVAVETDYEYWQVFGSTDEAVAYVIQLMGTISSFYERDIQVKWYLPYIRIWSTDACPFDELDTGRALDEFKFYWRAYHNPGKAAFIERDIAHMLSGKIYKAGMSDGDTLCNYDWGFAVSQGIGLYGSYPRPPQDFHPDNWDIAVVAHEAGHNFGSPHTHCYVPAIDNCGQPIDDCNERGVFECTPGTIMSYCGGDHCGGLSNLELRFHDRAALRIRQSVDASCLRHGINPVYVDWTNIGFEDGTIAHPYNTVHEGVQVAIPGGTVYIASGSYHEGFIANRPATLLATGGPVYIGP